MDLVSTIISWLATGPGMASVASFVAERIPGFQALDSQAKSNWILVIMTVVGLLATVYNLYVPVEVKTALVPIWGVLITAVIAWLSSQGFHAIDKRGIK